MAIQAKERRSSLFVQARRLQSKTRPISRPEKRGSTKHEVTARYQGHVLHREVYVQGTVQIHRARERLHKSSTTKGLMKCPNPR
jgi:hypothetical protein